MVHEILNAVPYRNHGLRVKFQMARRGGQGKAARGKVKRTTKPAKDEHWHLVERVVQLLEKSLAPNAEVLHNIWLPDKITGHKRQCDVVIRIAAARPVIAIVEVQDRSSKVPISTLEGWWQKKISVGADALICVSVLDYPRSVKDAVRYRYGPSVVLMTLRQVEAKKFPVTFPSAGVVISWGRFKFLDASTVALEGARNDGTEALDLDEEMPGFHRAEKSCGFSLVDLVRKELDTIGTPKKPGVYKKSLFIPTDPPLYVDFGGQQRRVLQLVIPIMYKIEETEIHPELSVYEQIDVGGSIAWAAAVSGILDGETAQIRQTFVPNNSGGFDVFCNGTLGNVEFCMGKVMPVFENGMLRLDFQLNPTPSNTNWETV